MSKHNRIPTNYELKEIEEIIKWEKEPPSVLEKISGAIGAPIAWLTSKIIPSGAIEGALCLANNAAKALTDTGDILRDAKVDKIEDLKNIDLEECDALANSVHNWAIGIASVEGGATGSIGLAGVALDIPALISFSLRTIHKIGLCYGYVAKTQNDELFVKSILAASGANTMEEKTGAILLMKQIQQMLINSGWKQIAKVAATKPLSKEAGVLAIKQLAKQLGINLTKRKALQAIPVIGAGVGATMNAKYINDICWSARRSFQRRWLEDNSILVDCKEI